MQRNGVAKKRGHAQQPLGKRRTAGWLVCNRCGLLLLKNKPSRKEWERGCNADRDKEQVS